MVMLLLAGVTGFSVLVAARRHLLPTSTGILFLDDLFHPLDVDESRDPWEERIETDRHDFTQSPKTVGRGVGVIEMGYTYFYEDTGAEIEQSHVTPELMLRVGLTEDIELRVMWNYAWRTIDGEDEAKAVEGAEDLRWSLKLRTTEQDGSRPGQRDQDRLDGTHGWSGLDDGSRGVRAPVYLRVEDRRRLDAGRFLRTPHPGVGDFGLLPEEPASRSIPRLGAVGGPGFRTHRAQHDVRGMVWSVLSCAGR